MKSFTRYYCKPCDGMRLRSGRVINCVKNDKRLTAYTEQLARVIKETSITNNKCKMLQTVFTLLEEYSDLFLDDVNFIDTHRVMSNKFSQFVVDFEKYYDSKTGKNKGGYFCKCCPKSGASSSDIKSGNPTAFEKELHSNEDTRRNILKWALYFKQPHRKHKRVHKMMCKKTNSDVAGIIVGYL